MLALTIFAAVYLGIGVMMFVNEVLKAWPPPSDITWLEIVLGVVIALGFFTLAWPAAVWILIKRHMR